MQQSNNKASSTKSTKDEDQHKSTTRVIRRRVGQIGSGQTESEQNSANKNNVESNNSQDTVIASTSQFSEENQSSYAVKDQEIIISGILDNSKDGHGVLRPEFSESESDAYIASSQIRRLKLRPGDLITGPARQPKDNERYWGLLRVDTVNGRPVEEYRQLNRKNFLSLTPVFPDKHIQLEIGVEPLSLRLIDLIAPIGKGQRSLIVSPPKAGKTTILKDIALGVAKNNPDIHLMAVLVGERPEEVTDIHRHIKKITDGKGEVAASNFDESAQNQCRVAELALERASAWLKKVAMF